MVKVMLMEKTEVEIKNKDYSKEDILKSETVGDVLHVYRKLSVDNRYNNLSELQRMVADKLYELGDEEKSNDFTLLSAQTQNSEKIFQAATIFADVVDDFSRKVNDFSGSSEDLKRFSDNLTNSMEEFRITGGKISSAANQIDQASIRMDRASQR